MYLFLCLHLLIIADLLFRMLSSLCRAMASFSLRHRSHRLELWLYDLWVPKILYSNIRLIVLCQFGIWCFWMFSYGSHICAWMLFRKHHNKFLFMDFLRLVWYLLCIWHFWLDIFRWVGIDVFLYSCMFLQYYLLGDWLFFCYAY